MSAKSSFKTFKRKEILQTKIFSLETIFQSQPQARGDGGLGSGERMIFKQTYTLSLFMGSLSKAASDGQIIGKFNFEVDEKRSKVKKRERMESAEDE